MIASVDWFTFPCFFFGFFSLISFGNCCELYLMLLLATGAEIAQQQQNNVKDQQQAKVDIVSRCQLEPPLHYIWGKGVKLRGPLYRYPAVASSWPIR